MGKRRGGKKGGNPKKKNFKVVGAKSLKAKNTPKPVKIDLKRGKASTKEKLKEVDEQLVNLQDKIVKKPDQPKKTRRGRKGKNQRSKDNKEKLSKDTAEAADKIEAMDV